MAGIQRDKIGPFIQFTGPDRQRRKLRLTELGDREAERFVEKLNKLVRHVKYGVPLDDEVAAWAKRLRDKQTGLAEKLAEYGLLPKVKPLDDEAAPAVPTLGPYLESHLRIRTDVKSGTAVFYGHTKRNLVKFFGADKQLADVKPGDADEFRLWLLRPTVKDGTGGEGLSEATTRRRCTMASQFFRAAVRKGFITSNPFEGVGGKVKSNKARVYFISGDEAAKVLEACPDLEWRLIFALARYGGLRTPSEHYGLRWSDIDWERNKFLVHSPKTEHHEGGDCRWVPLFPELRPLLEKAFHEPGPAEFVISRYRNQANLRTRFRKIIVRAGLKPWPKLFQNLRSTRQTELAAKYPLHLVCSWLGNKAAIAAEHYLQTTDADFERAAMEPTEVVQGGANLAHSRTVSDVQDCSADDDDMQNDRERTLVTVGGYSGNPEGWAVRDSNP